MKKPEHEEISDQDFLDKIAGVPLKAGCAVIRVACTLFVLLKESDVPVWAKLSILASLGYFISPVDAIPDFLPGGFIDDLGVMTLLLGQLDVFLDAKALERVEQLLPKYCRRNLIESSD